MDVTFDPVEIRALGCLIEKHITTPEYYPLSLNSLVNACNQTTNRDPITTYNESTVEHALENLRQKGLVWTVSNSRVPKYGNRFSEKFGLSKPQTAAMCVLMLRGSQTAGEIRGRSGRLHEFANLEEVDQVLESLTHAEPPLVTKLPRAPGTKERRFAHLLGGDGVEGGEAQPAAAMGVTVAHADGEKFGQLEGQIEALRQELQELRQQFLELKKQFE